MKKLIKTLSFFSLLIVAVGCQKSDEENASSNTTQPQSLSVTETEIVTKLDYLIKHGEQSNTVFERNNSLEPGYVSFSSFLRALECSDCDDTFETYQSSLAQISSKFQIYVPFYEEYNEKVSRTFVFNNHSYANRYKVRGENHIENELISKEVMPEEALYVLYSGIAKDEIPGLPWRRCYCSRSTIIEPSEGGSPIASTRGTCAEPHGSSNACSGVCSRSNFSSECPGTSCPGC